MIISFYRGGFDSELVFYKNINIPDFIWRNLRSSNVGVFINYIEMIDGKITNKPTSPIEKIDVFSVLLLPVKDSTGVCVGCSCANEYEEPRFIKHIDAGWFDNR